MRRIWLYAVVVFVFAAAVGLIGFHTTVPGPLREPWMYKGAYVEYYAKAYGFSFTYSARIIEVRGCAAKVLCSWLNVSEAKIFCNGTWKGDCIPTFFKFKDSTPELSMFENYALSLEEAKTGYGIRKAWHVEVFDEKAGVKVEMWVDTEAHILLRTVITQQGVEIVRLELKETNIIEKI